MDRRIPGRVPRGARRPPDRAKTALSVAAKALDIKNMSDEMLDLCRDLIQCVITDAAPSCPSCSKMVEQLKEILTTVKGT
jgi:hypothetical protein